MIVMMTIHNGNEGGDSGGQKDEATQRGEGICINSLGASCSFGLLSFDGGKT